MSAYLSKLAMDAVLSKLGEKLADSAMVKKDDMATSTFESLKSHVRLLCAKTIDLDKSIKEAERCGQKKRKREVAEWLEQVHIALNEFLKLEEEMKTMGFVERFFHGGGATKLDEKVHNLIEHHQQLGDEIVVNDYDNKGHVFITTQLVGAEFEKNLKNILKFLGRNVSSIGIYGMGGVGKTTLAKHIYNRLLQGKKKSVFWTTVSHEFTIPMLQDQIAKFIGADISTERNEDIRAAILNKVLSERGNTILIFDDVWEGIDMKKLGDPLSVDGCKLLITTRSEIVCRKIHCDKVIHVSTLEENDAWKLFEDTIQMSLTGQVKEIAMSMVKLCGGLPLGIITIAGSMTGQTDLHDWIDALNELIECVMKQRDMKEHVFKVLEYSFDRLERSEEKDNGYSMTQHCFLYCSLYPEDHEIKKDDLIRRWIQEDFLGRRSPNVVCGRMQSTPSRRDLFSQGQAIMNRLIKVCLLENCSEDSSVKMHDLVREMAHEIADGKYKAICGHPSLKEIPNEEHWGQGLEKMSLMQNRISKTPKGMSPNCPKLSTLLLGRNSLPYIPISFFKLMPSLCILDLSYNKGIKGPLPFLSKMKVLKTLLLRGCYGLKTLAHLGKLKKLRELDLSETAVVEVLNGGEEKFDDLQFLSLNGCKELKRLPERLQQKFPNLQCLHLPTHIEAPLEEIVQLEHLEEFSGAVRNVFELNHSLRRGLTSSIRLETQENGLQGFKCDNNPLLKKMIEFGSYDFGSVEHGGGTTLLAQHIEYLYLRDCKGLRNGVVDVTLFLNNPTSIQYLELRWCGDMECIYMKEAAAFSNGDEVRSTSAIPPSPTHHHGLFSHLTLLKITFCDKMKKLGTVASQLQNLEQLEIGSCRMLEEIMEVSEDNGGGESQEASSSSSAVCLPKLKILRLEFLRSLKSICNALIVCSSIETITLWNCPALKKLPLVFGHPNYDSPPSHLRKVSIRSDDLTWWENLEMGHDTKIIRPMLQPFVVNGLLI